MAHSVELALLACGIFVFLVLITSLAAVVQTRYQRKYFEVRGTVGFVFQLIIETPPEVDLDKAQVGELFGDIEISHVSFRYQADGPLILDDVNLHVRPGEFVAFVGPSTNGLKQQSKNNFRICGAKPPLSPGTPGERGRG